MQEQPRIAPRSQLLTNDAMDFARAIERLLTPSLGLVFLALTLSCSAVPTKNDSGQAGGSLPPPSTSVRVDTIFYDSFESGSLAAWEDGYDATRHHIATDAAGAKVGTRYLDVTYPAGSDGGFLNHFFMPGYDSVYVRYYMKLDATWVNGVKLIGLYGSRIDDQWSAFGKAGVCPTGSDFFTSFVVTEPSGGNPPPTRFYTYYPDMARSGGVCWGSYGDNATQYFQPLTLSRGAWHKVEFWLRINTPGQSNLVQRFWIDDQLKGEWLGISIRTSDVLRINAVQLTFSICCGGAAQTQHSYVDDVLVTTGLPR